MILIVIAAAAMAPTPPTPNLPSKMDARTVMESQLATPPRTGAEAGLGPAEADAIIEQYLASIGRKLDPVEEGPPR